MTIAAGNGIRAVWNRGKALALSCMLEDALCHEVRLNITHGHFFHQTSLLSTA